MTVHLVNPSHRSFGVGVVTPRWLFVLAGATPTSYGRPRITDETLEPFDIHSVQVGVRRRRTAVVAVDERFPWVDEAADAIGSRALANCERDGDRLTHGAQPTA